MSSAVRTSFLSEIYKKLFQEFGAQHWWPAETSFEVIVGAILTQNTNWGNVEKALNNLRRAKVLELSALHKLSEGKLAQLIKPAGYFNVKAKRLKNVISFLYKEYDGDLGKARDESLDRLRLKLLAINGVGPETADSILLYAFEKPSFVVDSYTKRIFYRHGIINSRDEYKDVRGLFMDQLKHDTGMFNEYHALIVRLAKDFCRKTAPRCESCPLREISYSLSLKCFQCHKVLLPQEEKKKAKTSLGFSQKYLCLECLDS